MTRELLRRFFFCCPAAPASAAADFARAGVLKYFLIIYREKASKSRKTCYNNIEINYFHISEKEKGNL
ncbi:hypothetical protein DHL47_10100 [Streptococcus panodentis]|uniref:Secreted protein n=1 Tax=Streptococcus panodentis TaxID=1581472 RepID=A0ABS5AYN8_9STRE|nr:hypothetical protein [Streptococcus panodentis]